MDRLLGQNIVISNRDGAAGTVGFNALASAAPDGYTLGAGPTTPIANAPYLVKGVRYQVESFEYICQYFENIFVLAVTHRSPIKSAQELLAAAGANPGKLTYGHAGVGTIPRLAAENLADALDVKFTAVPFRGDNPMLPILLKGDLDFASTALSSIRGLDLRALVVFADRRLPSLPDVPTAKELGVSVSVPSGHNGMFAPKGLPEHIRARLELACAKAAKSPDLMDGLVPLASQPIAISGRNWMTRRMLIDAIRNDPDWKGGDYDRNPSHFIYTAPIRSLMTESVIQLQAIAPTREAGDAFYEKLVEQARKTDANNLLYATEAVMDYDPSRDLEKIKAKLMAINFADDAVNPPELDVMEPAIRRIRDARLVIVPATPDTHGHFTHLRAAFWKSHLAAFMRTLPPEM